MYVEGQKIYPTDIRMDVYTKSCSIMALEIVYTLPSLKCHLWSPCHTGMYKAVWSTYTFNEALSLMFEEETISLLAQGVASMYVHTS